MAPPVALEVGQPSELPANWPREQPTFGACSPMTFMRSSSTMHCVLDVIARCLAVGVHAMFDSCNTTLKMRMYVGHDKGRLTSCAIVRRTGCTVQERHGVDAWGRP